MKVPANDHQTVNVKDKAMKASKLSIIGNVFLSQFKLLGR